MCLNANSSYNYSILVMSTHREAHRYPPSYFISSHHTSSSYFISSHHNSSHLSFIISSHHSSYHLISCIVFTPVDVVKERLQVQSEQQSPSRSSQSPSRSTQSPSRSKYRDSLDALRTIVREEGWKGIYKGYSATIFSYGPFSASYFVIYEEVIRN